MESTPSTGDSFDENLGRLPAWTTFLVGCALVAVLSGVDFLSGSEISFSIFYLVPVLFVTWYSGRRWGGVLALVAAATWGIVDVAAGARYSSPAIPVWNSLVRLGFFIIALTLLDSLRRANLSVLALAHTDPLTGIPNARSFYSDLDREIARQRRYGGEFALAYVDLDRFKEVNDGHGHAAGDDVLRAVGGALGAAVRESDVVARVGGDEFAVLMPETDLLAASKTLQRVQSAIVETIARSDPRASRVGATVGVAVFRAAPVSADAAVGVADRAMYHAKRTERGAINVVLVPGGDGEPRAATART